jgi:hypothetical protein
MMTRRIDEDATVIDAYPQAFFEAENDSTSTELTTPRLQANRPVACVVDGKAEDANLSRDGEAKDALLELGAEDHFILAWGRANAAVASRGRQLLMSSGLNVALVLAIAFLAWRNEHKETYVFVRDALGNIIQADANSFLHAGDSRTEAEIKGFVRGWVFDAYTWTPLDVEDRLKAALRLVESKAQPVVKAGLGLAERKALVERGISGRVHDEREIGKEAQVVITRTQPLEVMVGFDRYQVDRSGGASELGHVFLRAHLKEVPRSPGNPTGLLIVDTAISERL